MNLGVETLQRNVSTRVLKLRKTFSYLNSVTPEFLGMQSIMKSTKIKLYDLAGAEDDRRFSPNCWRVRLALLHKGLPFETIPWRFTEKETIAFSGQGRAPVIVDREQVVYDSWAIAEYLEESYPKYPSLFGGEVGKSLSRFTTDWVEAVLNSEIMRLIITDVYSHLHEKDKDYFRTSREKKKSRTVETSANIIK